MHNCGFCGIYVSRLDRPVIVYGNAPFPRVIHGNCAPAFYAFSRNV